jgi:hypothetical protein
MPTTIMSVRPRTVHDDHSQWLTVGGKGKNHERESNGKEGPGDTKSNLRSLSIMLR